MAKDTAIHDTRVVRQKAKDTDISLLIVGLCDEIEYLHDELSDARRAVKPVLESQISAILAELSDQGMSSHFLAGLAHVIRRHIPAAAETVVPFSAAGEWHYPPYKARPIQGAVVEYDRADCTGRLCFYHGENAGQFNGWSVDSVLRWRYAVAPSLGEFAIGADNYKLLTVRINDKGEMYSCYWGDENNGPTHMALHRGIMVWNPTPEPRDM